MDARSQRFAGVSKRLMVSLLVAVVGLLVAFALVASAHGSVSHAVLVHQTREGTQVVSGYDGGVAEVPSAPSAAP